jgi:hypothetical protein
MLTQATFYLSSLSGSVIIFFWYNLVANFAREYEGSHDRFEIDSSYKCFFNNLSKLFYI